MNLAGYKSVGQIIKTYLAILVFSFVAFLVRLAKFDEFSFDFQVILFFVSIVMISVFWESLRTVNYILNNVLPFEKNITLRIAVQLVIGAVIGLAIRTFIYIWGEPKLPFHLDSLFAAATWAFYVIIATGVNLGFFTAYFIRRWKASIIYAERLEKEKAQVQFDNLKNQLNPHFLFNALTSLNTLIFENQKLASEFVRQLSKVYRYVLQNKEKNFVLLQTELDFIDHYVKLLETRFEGALRIVFDIKESAKEKAIVPVTLQILIENAIKHNIIDKEKPLTIEILSVGDYLIVSNNLQVKKRVDASNKLGLENLKSLYRFLTENPVIVEETTERFFVKIPLI